MSASRRKAQIVTTWVVVVAWVVGYTVAAATAAERPEPLTAVMFLVVPPLLWALAAQFLVAGVFDLGRAAVAHWRSGAGSRMSTMDLAGRLLATAVAGLPEGRREWGTAMLGELAEIREGSARWRFALSSVRATMMLPPAGGWPVLALVTGAVMASVVAVGPVVGAVVPGLSVFAVSFTGLVGLAAVLAVARSRRLWPPVTVPSLMVAGGVAGSIAATVIFLRREPAGAEYLPPPAAVYLAAVLVGCLWVVVATPRWLSVDRLAASLGAAAAVVFTGWSLSLHRLERTEPSPLLALVLTVVLVLTPFAVFIVPAFMAGRVGRSFRSGLRAAVWTVTAMVPLTYAVWLPEALRRHAIDGRSLDGEMVAPVGVNLEGALYFCLGIFPVFGLAFGAVGAALGARRALSTLPPQAAA